MKTLLMGIIAGGLLSATSFAQNTATPPANGTEQETQQSHQAQPESKPAPPSATATRIAPGSVIPVQLTKTVDAKKVKTGDAVEAKVTEDLKANNGEVVVPKDTKVMGHVTEAQPRSKEQKESQIGIAFDHAVMKNGNDMPLPMSIQAIIAPAALNPGSNEQPAAMPSGGGMSPSTNSGRMGTGTMPPSPNPPAAGGQWPSNSQTGPNPPITGNTKGVVGMSNLQLSTAQNTTEGSIVSSEKSNVKLDSGTLMLLRVNP